MDESHHFTLLCSRWRRNRGLGAAHVETQPLEGTKKGVVILWGSFGVYRFSVLRCLCVTMRAPVVIPHCCSLSILLRWHHLPQFSFSVQFCLVGSDPGGVMSCLGVAAGSALSPSTLSFPAHAILHSWYTTGQLSDWSPEGFLHYSIHLSLLWQCRTGDWRILTVSQTLAQQFPWFSSIQSLTLLIYFV